MILRITVCGFFQDIKRVRIKCDYRQLLVITTLVSLIRLLPNVSADSDGSRTVDNGFDTAPSDSDCPPTCSCLGTLVDCSKRKLSEVPDRLPVWCEILELSDNNIQELPREVFRHLTSLKKLYLSHNQLKSLDPLLFSDNVEVPNQRTGPVLQELKLNHNQLSEFPQVHGLINLTTLILHHNSINSLLNVTTSLYPNLETIDLSFNRLSNIPSGFFANSTKLITINLTNNKLVSFDRTAFDNLTRVEVLRLSKNKILALPKELLRSLRNLKELDLSRNKLRVIEGLSFHGLDLLQTLKLRRNELTQLLDGAFWGLSNIQYLHLDYNNLTNVSKGWLYGLSSLKQLSLSHNRIVDIDGDGWEFCRKLWELDLTYNKIRAIDKDTFSRFHSLQNLYLDHNLISFIEEGAFKSMSVLEMLSLSHNEISWTFEDSSGAFNGLERLLHLDLCHNQIKSISKRAFSGINRIQILDLTQNPITTIQDESFSSFKNLQELRLNSTSLLCDCNLKWLPIWLNSTSFRNKNVINSAKCRHPKWLMGKSLLQTNSEEFICEDFPKPYIIEEPKKDDEPVSALKGNNMTLSCKAASSSSSPMKFQWRKDNQLIDGETLTRNKITTFAHVHNSSFSEYSSSFQLVNIVDEDEGKYQCIATNQFGAAYSQKVRINVHVMPVFTKMPANVTVKVGNTARLECAARGQPTPEIAWQKEAGDDFPAARERRMHVMPTDDVFFIVEVKLTDMGMYTCTATNAAGVITTSAYLNVLEMPSFVRPMHQRKETAAGETAVLECMSSGSPKPILTWLKDGEPLIATERHFFTADNQLLIIVKTQSTDSGAYTCEMSNILGSVKDSTALVIASSADDPSRMPDFPSWAWFFSDTKTAGIIVMAVFICIVITSLVWVIIIYHTRKPEEEYTPTNTDETTLPGELDSFTGIIISASCGVSEESMPNPDDRCDDSDSVDESSSRSSDSSSNRDSGTGDSATGDSRTSDQVPRHSDV